MGIATSLKRHYVEMVSRQSSVVLVVKRRDAWHIAMKVTQDRGFPVVTKQAYRVKGPGAN